MMHNDILQFWRRSGFSINNSLSFKDSGNILWWGNKHPHDSVMLRVILAEEFIDGTPTAYYFDGKIFNEEEALKVIKLKVFL
jgi:hypothetical protein